METIVSISMLDFVKQLDIVNAVEAELNFTLAGDVKVGMRLKEAGDKPNAKPFTVKAVEHVERKCPGRIHLKTTRGDWCIPVLTLLYFK